MSTESLIAEIAELEMDIATYETSGVADSNGLTVMKAALVHKQAELAFSSWRVANKATGLFALISGDGVALRDAASAAARAWEAASAEFSEAQVAADVADASRGEVEG